MSPWLFSGTPFQMDSWSFCLLAGFIFVSLLAVVRRPKEFPITGTGIFFLFSLILISGIFGAKILYMALHWQELVSQNYTAGQWLYVSGFAFLGTIPFEFLAIFAFTKLRVKRISFLEAGDYVFPFIILHVAFVRTGCFLTGCCYGKTTNLPWGMVFDEESMMPVHPTQVYSIVSVIFIFFLIRHLYKRYYRAMPKGVILFGSLFSYGLLRFFIEFLRADSFPVLGIITLAQVAMLALAFVSAASIGIIFALNPR